MVHGDANLFDGISARLAPLPFSIQACFGTALRGRKNSGWAGSPIRQSRPSYSFVTSSTTPAHNNCASASSMPVRPLPSSMAIARWGLPSRILPSTVSAPTWVRPRETPVRRPDTSPRSRQRIRPAISGDQPSDVWLPDIRRMRFCRGVRINRNRARAPIGSLDHCSERALSRLHEARMKGGGDRDFADPNARFRQLGHGCRDCRARTGDDALQGRVMVWRR